MNGLNKSSNCLMTDVRGVGVGGKGSTQYVVKGSQKEFPRELLQDLKIVCQVQTLVALSEYLVNVNIEEMLGLVLICSSIVFENSFWLWLFLVKLISYKLII